MGVEISFHYDTEGKKNLEAPEVSSQYFISLFDCDAGILKMWDLWPSFIQEYREHIRQTSTEGELQATEENVEDWQDREVPDPDELWEDRGNEWKASNPFGPEEARIWAERWMYFIGEWNPAEMPELFPYETSLDAGKSTFNKKATVKELERIVRQAECARQHGVRMTVKVMWG